MKKIIKRVTLVFMLIITLMLIGALSVNFYIKSEGGKYFLTPEEAMDMQVDCILVLGAGLNADGSPSSMLADRLNRAVELYSDGKKLLMSGDNGSTDYDEVTAMKKYAVEKGAKSEDIFKDHAGFSTYESMYRARDVFKVQSVIIVTQEYHLYRAVYCARKLGLTAFGVAADGGNYSGQSMRELREIAARNKDFFYIMFKPKPKFLGDAIPISGDGDAVGS